MSHTVAHHALTELAKHDPQAAEAGYEMLERHLEDALRDACQKDDAIRAALSTLPETAISELQAIRRQLAAEIGEIQVALTRTRHTLAEMKSNGDDAFAQRQDRLLVRLG